MRFWRVPAWPQCERDGSAVILMYHSVSRIGADPWGLRVAPRQFAEHMAVLRTHTNPIRLDELASATVGDGTRRPVVVTFDDGYADNLLHALPILERYRIHATIFVATGFVGSHREYWWDDLERILLRAPRLPAEFELKMAGETHRWKLRDAVQRSAWEMWRHRHWRAWHDVRPTQRHALLLRLRELMQSSSPAECQWAMDALRRWAGVAEAGRRTHRPLTIEQLRQLSRSPYIEIGAHTVTHPSLAATSIERQRAEIITSKTWLEEAINKPVTSFAYPFGTAQDFDAQTVNLVRQAGFQRACTTLPGAVTAANNSFEYPRQSPLDWDGREFLARLFKWLGCTPTPARSAYLVTTMST